MDYIKKIRNFSIISHIDHGKSTLADRFLELTNTVPKNKMRSRYLDMMDLEREKGITIKMQPVRMKFGEYTLNLIDTPGHVDFNYEVSRSLAAVEGTILLVDGTKGIQSQTLANLDLARKEKLVIVSAVNKIDLSQSEVEETRTDMSKMLNVPEREILAISAKKGTNVENLLNTIIEKTPPPVGDSNKPLKALVFDSKFDSFKGVITYVRIFEGTVRTGEKIYLMHAGAETQIKEVGYFSPQLKASQELKAGEIGYIATGIKDPTKIKVGETITHSKTKEIEPLPGYQEPKPMVFASVYPEAADDFEMLKESLNKLKLNDASLTFERESKEFLGRGFRCGFLGSLHAEIIWERLKREFNMGLVISSPSVIYQIINKKDESRLIFSTSDWPDRSIIKEIREPWMKLEIMTPISYLGAVSEILKDLKGKHIEDKYITQEKLILVYEAPLRKVIIGFFDKLKGVSQGFASMNYEFIGYKPSSLIKLDILIAGKKEEILSRIVNTEDAFNEGKKIVFKLKEILPPQLFAVPIQAAISGKIIARATMKARRKDVTAPLYGGDVTRKMKLLKKQKKGKQKLKLKGRVRIPPEVYLKMFSA